MIRKFPLSIRIIAGILVITFLCQDVIWANPDVMPLSSATLQIQPMSKNIGVGMPELRDLMRMRLVQICATENCSDVFELVKELKRRGLQVPFLERGIEFVLDFARAEYGESGNEWRVPCSGSYPGKPPVEYIAFIGPEGLKDVAASADGKKTDSAPSVDMASSMEIKSLSIDPVKDENIDSSKVIDLRTDSAAVSDDASKSEINENAILRGGVRFVRIVPGIVILAGMALISYYLGAHNVGVSLAAVGIIAPAGVLDLGGERVMPVEKVPGDSHPTDDMHRRQPFAEALRDARKEEPGEDSAEPATKQEVAARGSETMLTGVKPLPVTPVSMPEKYLQILYGKAMNAAADAIKEHSFDITVGILVLITAYCLSIHLPESSYDLCGLACLYGGLRKIDQKPAINDKRRTAALNGRKSLSLNGIVWRGVQPYIDYLKSAGIPDIIGIELDGSDKGRVDIYAVRAGRDGEGEVKDKIHSIFIGEDKAPLACESDKPKALIYHILGVLERQNNPIQIGLANPDRFIVGERVYVNIYGAIDYLAFMGHERKDISIHKFVGKKNIEPSVEFVRGAAYNKENVLFSIRLDANHIPIGILNNKGKRTVGLAEILKIQNGIDEDTYREFRRYKISHRVKGEAKVKIGGIDSQLECLRDNLPDANKDLADIAAGEAANSEGLSRETVTAIMEAVGVTRLTQLQVKGRWPIYYLLRSAAKKHGMIQKNQPVEAMTRDEAVAALEEMPEDKRWLKYLKRYHYRLYKAVKAFELLTSRIGYRRAGRAVRTGVKAASPRPRREPKPRRESRPGQRQAQTTRPERTVDSALRTRIDDTDRLGMEFAAVDVFTYVTEGHGDRIVDLRTRVSLSQPALSRRADMGTYRLFEIEKGRLPYAGEVKKIAHALNVSEKYILRGEDPPDWDTYRIAEDPKPAVMKKAPLKRMPEAESTAESAVNPLEAHPKDVKPEVSEPEVVSRDAVLKPVKRAIVGPVNGAAKMTGLEAVDLRTMPYEKHLALLAGVFVRNYEESFTGVSKVTIPDEEKALQFFNSMTPSQSIALADLLSRRLERNYLSSIRTASYNWAMVAAICCMPQISVTAYNNVSYFLSLYNPTMYEEIFRGSPFSIKEQFLKLYRIAKQGRNGKSKIDVKKTRNGVYHYLSGSIVRNEVYRSFDTGDPAQGVGQYLRPGVVSVIGLILILPALYVLWHGGWLVPLAQFMQDGGPVLLIGAVVNKRSRDNVQNTFGTACDLYIKGMELFDQPDQLDAAIELLRESDKLSDQAFRKAEKLARDSAVVTRLGILGNLGVALLNKTNIEDDDKKYYYEASKALEEGLRIIQRYTARREEGYRKDDPTVPIITDAIAKSCPELRNVAEVILLRLGHAYVGMRRFSRAYEAFMRLRALKPRSWFALIGLGGASAYMMKLDDAMEYFKQSLDVAESDLREAVDSQIDIRDEKARDEAREKELLCREKLAKSLINVGSVYYLKGMYDEALAYYERARLEFLSEKAPNLRSSYYEIFIPNFTNYLAAKGSAEQAIVEIEKAARELSEGAAGLDSIEAGLKAAIVKAHAEIYLHYMPPEEGVRQAIGILEEARASSDSYQDEIIIKLSEAYNLAGERAQAIEMLERESITYPRSISIITELAANYCGRGSPGDLVAAEKIADAAVKIDPGARADSEYIRGLADMLRSYAASDNKARERALKDARTHLARCREEDLRTTSYYYVTTLVSYLLGDRDKAAKQLEEFMKEEDHKFSRIFVMTAAEVGKGHAEMRDMMSRISRDETAVEYVRGYARKILEDLPATDEVEVAEETGPVHIGVEAEAFSKEVSAPVLSEAEKRAEIEALLAGAERLKSQAELYYKVAHIDSQTSLLTEAADICSQVLGRRDIANKKALGEYHERARKLSRELDSLRSRISKELDFVGQNMERACALYEAGDYIAALESVAAIYNKDSFVSGAFQFRQDINDTRNLVDGYQAKDYAKAIDYASRIKTGHERFRGRYEMGDLTPGWMKESEDFADAALADCRKALEPEQVTRRIIAMAEEGKIEKALDEARAAKTPTNADYKAMRKAVFGRVEELFDDASDRFSKAVSESDLDAAEACREKLKTFRSLTTQGVQPKIDKAEAVIEIWKTVKASPFAGDFTKHGYLAMAIDAYQREETKPAVSCMQLAEPCTDNGRDVAHKFAFNAQLFAEYREEDIESDESFKAALFYAGRVKELYFIVDIMGEDGLFLAAQAELQSIVGTQPMIHPASELPIEEARDRLSRMVVDDRYGCTYEVDESGMFQFLSGSKSDESKAFVARLNKAAERLYINIRLLEIDVKSKVFDELSEVRMAATKGRLRVGAARNCPFTSVRNKDDRTVLFDADWVDLIMKMAGDPAYADRYGHVISWLISERLFHEVLHADSEKEQLVRDIHYYYLLLNTPGLEREIGEFFDLSIVKGSGVAQKTKTRFKFIAHQAKRLNKKDAIESEAITEFVGPYDGPISVGKSIYQPMVTSVARRRDLRDDEDLTRAFVEKLFSIVAQKKVVLAFSNTLGSLNGRPVGIFEAIKELKSNPLFKHLLKNVEVIVCPPQNMHNKMQKYFGDPDAEIFTFVNENERALVEALASRAPVRIFYINDSKLPINESYPLLETVTISLLDYRSGDAIESIPEEILSEIGIEAIRRKGNGLEFDLMLPRSKQHDIEEDTVKRYTRLKKLLISA